MRDDGGRSTRGLASTTAYVVAWITVVSCGGTTSNGGNGAGGGTSAGPSAQELCAQEAVLPCAHTTADQCAAKTQQLSDLARAAGCGTLYDEGASCTSAHPDTCSGDTLVQDPSCGAVGTQLGDCLTKSNPTALCTLGVNDPCSLCLCESCPCDSACATSAQQWLDCDKGCSASAPADQAACFQRCNAIGSPSFRTYTACTASSVCNAACAARPVGAPDASF